MAGSPGVPEPEPSDSVGVNMLGSPLQLGKNRKLVPGILGLGMVRFKQDSAVRLND